MVDWHSDDVVERTAFIFDQMLAYILGFYGWQFILTFHYIEWPLLARRLKFQLVYVPYLTGRYTFLAALLSLVFISRPPRPSLNCKACIQALSAVGNIAVASSSANLLARTLTLWRHKRLVQAFLLSLGVTQLLVGFTVGLTQVHIGTDLYAGASLCGEVYTNHHHELVVFYFYTLFYDFSILIFTVAGLGPKAQGDSTRLWSRVCRQGLWYLMSTVIVNVPVVVFAWMNLNPIMNVLFAIPATAISVISSSAAVVSLVKLRGDNSSAESRTPGMDGAAGTASGKGTGQLTTHITISPSLFSNSDELSDELPDAYSFDSEAAVTLRRGQGGPTSKFTMLRNPSEVVTLVFKGAAFDGESDVDTVGGGGR